MRHLLTTFLACLMAASGCVRTPPKPALTAPPHYVLGEPYQAGGHWYYPAEGLRAGCNRHSNRPAERKAPDCGR
ncbi:MAG: hypothetical protein WDN04_13535 [Rhodospirillales bacterium]